MNISGNRFIAIILTLILTCNCRLCLNHQTIVRSAIEWIITAFRPSTRNAHRTHFKTFIAFAVHMNFEIEFSLVNILAFLECLIHNNISPKVTYYISSLKTIAKLFFIPASDLYHTSISLYLRSVSINLPYSPTPTGIFTLSVLQSILRTVSC